MQRVGEKPLTHLDIWTASVQHAVNLGPAKISYRIQSMLLRKAVTAGSIDEYSHLQPSCKQTPVTAAFPGRSVGVQRP